MCVHEVARQSRFLVGGWEAPPGKKGGHRVVAAVCPCGPALSVYMAGLLGNFGGRVNLISCATEQERNKLDEDPAARVSWTIRWALALRCGLG